MTIRKWPWILGSVICILSVFAIQKSLDQAISTRQRLGEKLIYIPSGRFLKAATLGFHVVLADLLWTRAVIYFGEHYYTDKDYRWLYSLLDATTTLDPQNILAYRFGGNLLALEGDDVKRSIELLKKGIRNNPDEDWRLYFLLGFDYFYYMEDYVSAAKYFEKAVRMPGHPAYLPRLVARMYAKGERTDTAIEFLQEIQQQYDDENIKAAIAERLNILMAKRQARILQSIVEEYEKAYGKYPREIKELVQVGLLKEMPVYPGGQYVINPNSGMVDWISESTPQWP
jgi:tetratricopeptide (TPR) repeat protein